MSKIADRIFIRVDILISWPVVQKHHRPFEIQPLERNRSRGVFILEALQLPYKPKSPCGYPGCPALTDGRYCHPHQKQMEAQYNRYERSPAAKKRYGRAWKRIRDRYIAAHPLCEQCSEPGKPVSAEEVHHKEPLAAGGTNDITNLMSLCHSCHSRITAREGGRWKRQGG